MQKISWESLNQKAPIGVFDSGLGGLMVLQDIVTTLPSEEYIYVGDEEMFPYGQKSIEMLKTRCLSICNWLVDQGVKIIVIACNTATAAALDTLQETLSVPVIGVVRAGVMSALETTKNKSIGILATKATIELGVYQKKLLELDKSLNIVSVAAPKLVDYVQSNLDQFLFDPTPQMVDDLKLYTSDFVDKDCDTVVLGCTHFPALTPVLQKELGLDVSLVSPSKNTAIELADFLSAHKLIGTNKQDIHFYTTGQETSGMQKFWAKEGDFNTLCV